MTEPPVQRVARALYDYWRRDPNPTWDDILANPATIHPSGQTYDGAASFWLGAATTAIEAFTRGCA